MTLKNNAVRTLAWIQLLISLIILVAVVFAYSTYRTSLRQALDSLSTSIISVSKVVDMTTETVESREMLINSTKQTLIATRAAIQEVRTTVLGQTRQAPQRAEELRAISALVLRLGDSFNSVSDGLISFSAPTGIEFKGIKSTVVMSHPLESHGRRLKTDAQNIKTTGEGLLQLSNTVATEGERLGATFGKLSDQTLLLLAEIEKTLESVQRQNLPNAVHEMRNTAEQLRLVSAEVGHIKHLGTFLLAIGLLFSAWCIMNSLSMLSLVGRSARQDHRQ